MEQARDVSQAIIKSSNRIWLAGLGAFARAQEEGAKVFDALVSEGERLESTTRKAAAKAASAARDAASAKAKEMQEIAGGTWDRLEQVFEARVARALEKRGIHTHGEVQELAARVDELAAAVNALARATGAAKAKPARPPTGRRRRAKPAARAKR